MIQRVPRRGDRTGVPRFGLVPDPGRRDYPDGGIRGRAWGVDVGGLSGLPGSATWPPARYRPPVFVVPRAEPALQLRLLQPVDPGDQRERDETRVPQQVWPPQQNRLAEDRGVEREVYGVAHVPVQAADDEVRGRCDGCRGTEPFDHEPGERGHQYGGPGHHQYGTEYPKRYEVGQWRTRVPVGDQPRNEPDDGTRGKDEEDRASGCGNGALHGCHPFAARWGGWLAHYSRSIAACSVGPSKLPVGRAVASRYRTTPAQSTSMMPLC